MPPLRRTMLGLLSGLSALGALATNIILPSFPQIGATFAQAPDRLSLLLSSFFATFALGQLIVGPLSDRIGRRPVILGGLMLFTLGSGMGALAPDFESLIAARIVQAMGACAASVLARAVARDLFEGAELARTLSLVMVAMAAAPGFSPLIGSGLAAAFGWRGQVRGHAVQRQGALHRRVVELAQQGQRIGQRKRGRHGPALCPSH